MRIGQETRARKAGKEKRVPGGFGVTRAAEGIVLFMRREERRGERGSLCAASPSTLSKMCFVVALLMPRDRRTLDLCMESCEKVEEEKRNEESSAKRE